MTYTLCVERTPEKAPLAFMRTRVGRVVVSAVMSAVIGLLVALSSSTMSGRVVIRSAAAAALVFAVMTAQVWGLWLYHLLRDRMPGVASLFWHMCLEKHDQKIKRRVLMACIATSSLSSVLYVVLPA